MNLSSLYAVLFSGDQYFHPPGNSCPSQGVASRASSCLSCGLSLCSGLRVVLPFICVTFPTRQTLSRFSGGQLSRVGLPRHPISRDLCQRSSVQSLQRLFLNSPHFNCYGLNSFHNSLYLFLTSLLNVGDGSSVVLKYTVKKC